MEIWTSDLASMRQSAHNKLIMQCQKTKLDKVRFFFHLVKFSQTNETLKLHILHKSFTRTCLKTNAWHGYDMANRSCCAPGRSDQQQGISRCHDLINSGPSPCTMLAGHRITRTAEHKLRPLLGCCTLYMMRGVA